MPRQEVSAPAPGSMEAEAIAALEKEGHVIGTGQPDAIDGEVKDNPIPPKDDPKKDNPKDEPKKDDPKDESKKTDRSPTMVEAWKLKVAEDQKSKLEADLEGLKKQFEEGSKSKSEVAVIASDLKDEIAKLAADKNVDVEFLSEFADTILKRAEAKYKPSVDVEKSLKQLQDERDLEKQLNEYSAEFSRDVLPLVKDMELSDEALSQIKTTLRDMAFSETYSKVPLKEIFAIKQAELNIPSHKKSSEGKGIKSRTSDAVDIESISDEDFSKLSHEKIAEFIEKKSSSSWRRPTNVR